VQVADYLDLHFREPLDVRELAHRVACGRTALLRQFKTAFGMTIGSYQTRLRLRQAVIDLRENDSKIDDVARMVGYRSPKSIPS
jgi:AraC-like DNA-binding protein